MARQWTGRVSFTEAATSNSGFPGRIIARISSIHSLSGRTCLKLNLCSSGTASSIVPSAHVPAEDLNVVTEVSPVDYSSMITLGKISKQSNECCCISATSKSAAVPLHWWRNDTRQIVPGRFPNFTSLEGTGLTSSSAAPQPVPAPDDKDHGVGDNATNNAHDPGRTAPRLGHTVLSVRVALGTTWSLCLSWITTRLACHQIEIDLPLTDSDISRSSSRFMPQKIFAHKQSAESNLQQYSF